MAQGLQVLYGIVLPLCLWPDLICLSEVQSMPVPGRHTIARGTRHTSRVQQHIGKDWACVDFLYRWKFQPGIYS